MHIISPHTYSSKPQYLHTTSNPLIHSLSSKIPIILPSIQHICTRPSIRCLYPPSHVKTLVSRFILETKKKETRKREKKNIIKKKNRSACKNQVEKKVIPLTRLSRPCLLVYPFQLVVCFSHKKKRHYLIPCAYAVLPYSFAAQKK